MLRLSKLLSRRLGSRLLGRCRLRWLTRDLELRRAIHRLLRIARWWRLSDRRRWIRQRTGENESSRTHGQVASRAGGWSESVCGHGRHWRPWGAEGWLACTWLERQRRRLDVVEACKLASRRRLLLGLLLTSLNSEARWSSIRCEWAECVYDRASWILRSSALILLR
jgi:hypothetical protein